MKILFVSSECAPYSKSGGLADVAGSLPPALKKAGDEICVVTPYYKCVKEKFQNDLSFVKSMTITLGSRQLYCGLFRTEYRGVPIWFVDNEEFFERDRLYGYADDALRFAFFCRAVIDLLPDYGFKPDIIHCNDWESALAVIYFKDLQAKQLTRYRSIRTVFTIHNIAYQGQFGADLLGNTFGLDGGWYQGGLGFEYDGRHDINLMKGAMLMADAVSTVSPNYARELHYPEFAFGLQGVVDMIDARLYGILNGLDESRYDSAGDKNLPANFTAEDLSGKAKCKLALQKEFGLVQTREWPLLGFVARLVEQKGIELIKQVLPGLMDLGVQIIIFGQGDQNYVDYFNWAAKRWPGMVGFSSDYNDVRANRVFAGADFYLMPSRFEPCGLSQMMAMRFGTIPIVHSVGGLRDSVRAYKEFDGLGDGFSFVDYTAKALYLTVVDALKIYFGNRTVLELMRKRCMTQDLSWDKSAKHYQRMYMDIADLSASEKRDIPFEKAYTRLRDAYYKIDAENRKKHPDLIRDDYNRVIQIHFYGRAEGTMFASYENGVLSVEPYNYENADAYVDGPFSLLLLIAQGKAGFDEMFLNGQIRITGNLSKAYEMKKILAPIPGTR